MKSLLVPSVARYAFNKLLKGLKSFGYDANFASELERRAIVGARRCTRDARENCMC